MARTPQLSFRQLLHATKKPQHPDVERERKQRSLRKSFLLTSFKTIVDLFVLFTFIRFKSLICCDTFPAGLEEFLFAQNVLFPWVEFKYCAAGHFFASRLSIILALVLGMGLLVLMFYAVC